MFQKQSTLCDYYHVLPHSFRVTTITDLLEQGVPLEDVQRLAGHADPRTTRLYDRRHKKITRNIVERISIYNNCPYQVSPYTCTFHTLIESIDIERADAAIVLVGSAFHKSDRRCRKRSSDVCD